MAASQRTKAVRSDHDHGFAAHNPTSGSPLSLRLSHPLLPVKEWIEKLKASKKLDESEVQKLCDLAKPLFDKEANVEPVPLPCTIVGDIHGQWYDLQEVFELAGWPPETHFVFLGDYVDRGYFSVECVSLVVALKIAYPDKVHLIRGNHESRQITQVYGFYDECLRKYGTPTVWKYFVELFDLIPLGILVDDSMFCVHGGLSPAVTTLDGIDKLDRRQEVPHEGPICDLIWSDPDDRVGWGVSPRGAGYTFGEGITLEWSSTNNVSLTVRAHQLMMEGFKWTHKDKLLTLFSAPNYSYRCGNRAAIMKVTGTSKDEVEVIAFDAATRPNDGPTMGRRTPDYFL
eukprot:TRINITY_DN2838_c0_g1_i2.p1 TRINITY_DN2838_c0_g1~~TRINITY_DN2838_c0_g1_i2.p1  ORF type:complete len:343 (-),score=45.24 TRINITY_DN2838_c0_g1_i2:126-1154(-)